MIFKSKKQKLYNTKLYHISITAKYSISNITFYVYKKSPIISSIHLTLKIKIYTSLSKSAIQKEAKPNYIINQNSCSFSSFSE